MRVARLLNERLEVVGVCQWIVEHVLTLLPIRSSAITLLDPDGNLHVLARDGDPLTASEGLVLPRGVGVTGRAVQESRPLWSGDVLGDTRFVWPGGIRDRLVAGGQRALLAVPLRPRGRTIGALTVADRRPRAFTDAEVRLVQAFADQAAIALDNAQLHEDAERRRSEAEQLAQVARTMAGALGVSAVATHVAESLVAMFDALATCVARLDSDGALVMLAAHDAVGSLASADERVRPGRELLETAMREGRPCRSPDILDDSRIVIDEERRRFITGTQLRSVLAVPLVAGGHTIGALSLGFEAGRSVSERDTARLQAFADLAASALDRALLHDEAARAEAALRASEAELRQAQKMEAVGRLAGGIAHDFNNLVTIITGRSEFLLQRLAFDAAACRDLELIKTTAERAGTLTKQLLAFSRRQVLRPRVLDLNRVVAGVAQMLQRLIGEDVHLVTRLAPDLGAVHADPTQIEQIILNLAVNARDAMPRGGRLRIETANVHLDDDFVAAHPDSSRGAHVLLQVSDTGSGMSPEVQAHIFEPFFTTKEVGRGTGLGLATVYGIVKQHGGSIGVESAPDVGATFRIYLQRVDDAGEPGGPDDEATASPPAPRTVLLVEDEDLVRELAHQVLTSYGYETLAASGPAEALDLVRRHDGPIHLLLTDVVMPRMGGRALAECLQAERPEMRVLYMSGYAEDEIVHRGGLAPGTPLLPKPFTLDAFMRKVRETLDLEPEG
ncbi:MAG TPA: GAF domain-containing protein [Methylomirabilota bacterium]|nr:GAF domain-containing protein [Methylomirabilota bacterium]